jgi:hypothetical protein
VQVQKHNLEQYIEWKVLAKVKEFSPEQYLKRRKERPLDSLVVGICFSDSEYLSHCLKACEHNIQYNCKESSCTD